MSNRDRYQQGREVVITVREPGHTRPVELEGNLHLPEGAEAVVIFAHGSGSSRHSPRNKFVAQVIRQAGIGTLLFDLLTPDEESRDVWTGELRFNIPLLADRLAGATDWLVRQEELGYLAVGYFGASTGGGAALVAAAKNPDRAKAVVSRGGRPDLAGEYLDKVRAPTLLIVGGEDHVVIGLNRQAMEQMSALVRLEIVSGAGHLFEEPGALEEVARLSRDWFQAYLAGPS
ncbi:MAG: dienelactone hydrolase family protein [Thermoleophilia bacterium]